MATGDNQVQLPAGYEDAKPVAAASASPSISLPAGYEDAKPIGASASTAQQPPNDYLHNAELGINDFENGAINKITHPIDTLTGVASGIWHQLPPVALAEQTKQILPVINSYEKARAAGASVPDAIKAADDAAKQHVSAIKQAGVTVDAFRANPTRETMKEVLNATASVAAMMGLGAAAGDIGTPAEAAPAEAETATSSLKVNPFRTSKIEPVVARNVAKAGLPEGEAGVTTQEANAATKQSVLNAQSATQTNVEQALQNIASRHAEANGLPEIPAGTAGRDVLVNNGNALVEAGKADYKTLDQFTDGKFTNAQNELKNAQMELQQNAGKTTADSPTLEANVIRAQMNVDNLFDKAVENGMPKELADTARAKFRAGQATLDVGHDVRMANRARGTTGTRTTDLNALENRWQARYDSGRLQQAFGGDQAAKDALTEVHAAREASEVFKSMPSTESKALQELVANHTTTGKFGTSTDWKAVRSDFSKMPDRTARFSDVPKVEKFINDQAFYQNLRTAGKAALGLVIGGGLTSLGYDLAK